MRLWRSACRLLLASMVVLMLSTPRGASAGAPTFAPDAQTTTHTVQPGEGLYRISLRYSVSIADIMAANGLSNPDAIYSGQVLIIPAAGYSNNNPPPSSGNGQSTSGVHVVQSGETLFRIAQLYGVSVQALASANNLLNPSSIYAGQQLVIPGGGTPATNPPPPAGTTPATGTHIVQPGETLGMISARYGVSVATLAQANRLSNPSLIYVGQQLVIPGGGTSSGPATQPPPTAAGTHIVQPGETLFRIATQYGVSVDALRAANGLTGNTIFSGQMLTIPTGGNPPAPAPAPITPSGPVPSPTITDGKQIVVVLSQQAVYAFENGQLLKSFVVSTGMPATPTVQGDYTIYVKYDSQRMVGPGYDLPGVPWVMYFYQGYGLHGTYWHNNFGQTMSHGCVNMRTDEALWLYQWAPVGTAVRVIWA
jgi:LysM repeat protein